jgi:hypothetical protein
MWLPFWRGSRDTGGPASSGSKAAVLTDGVASTVGFLMEGTNPLKMEKKGWAPVAHTCNPSYSGGRDQEDHGSKPAWANSSQDPILKNPITKKEWWNGLRCRPQIQAPIPQQQQQKKQKERKKGKLNWCSFPTIKMFRVW